MKTKGTFKGKVNVVTMGCAKNLVDSEVLVTQLKANGIETYHESGQSPDVVIINTCGFIDSAKEESVEAILQYAEARKKGLINKLRGVTMGTPGYIAGETLKRVDQPGESLVVTKWQSEFYWNQWLESKERAEIQDKIDQLLETPTEYEIYEYD